jgi:alkylated DNA repair dioxygenase AlkB
MSQASLFDDLAPPAGALPPGLRYEPGWLPAADEAALIELIQRLPLQQARYKAYTARRRVVSYGGEFDYDRHELRPGAPLVDALLPLRERVARWAGLAPAALVHTLVAEYAPGTPLGWHRDVPDFEDVFGVSLGSAAWLRLRPYPPQQPRREDMLRLCVEPRSIYALQGQARWAWQHSVAPVVAPRWSVTFRTARRRPG